MKVLVTYLSDEYQFADMPTIEIDTDDGTIILNGYDLTPSLSLKLKELAVQLHSFHIDMKKEKEK